ncbi:antitoxin Xre/MbcA/ParS toxin-binding domain-containing protein [Sulfitobacter delicatus]|uniref:Antitoxin Xre/MbcA/ParS-like toxin-binding domain-containing protein n=1 Tax=Sulfitobacter delicatus TaxID=218672 RepID=A0A1G7XH47_9RHOB|nr:antitoxin Xre/MbcA/ParS toxin-binding domain-containing protein [Sulfitobacter delicatus]SDG83548.1 Protein of unknown function [Sulfitobacter delicatus]
MNQTELIELCTQVMGSAENAEEWRSSPAIGLESKRPSDLMETQSGRDQMEILLTQIQYGVYI